MWLREHRIEETWGCRKMGLRGLMAMETQKKNWGKKKTKKNAKNPNPVKYNNRKHELKSAPVFVLYYSNPRSY